MPKIYTYHHNQLINNYIEFSGDIGIPYFRKENHFFAKNNNGFLIQITSSVRPYLANNLSN